MLNGSETYGCITVHSKHTGNTFTKASLGLKYQVLAFVHSLLNSMFNKFGQQLLFL